MKSRYVLEVDNVSYPKVMDDGGALVLLKFSAVWCAPCASMAPIVETIAFENLGKIIVGEIDVDVAPELAVKYKIKGVPTVILLKYEQGKTERTEVGRVVGMSDQARQDILDLIERAK